MGMKIYLARKLECKLAVLKLGLTAVCSRNHQNTQCTCMCLDLKSLYWTISHGC